MISLEAAHFTPKSLLLLVLMSLLTLGVHRTRAVKGCVTMMTGSDFSVKESICERLDTKFTRIPESLPKEVIRLTINFQMIHVLDGRQLHHLPNLTYLNMDSNKIAVIKRDAFLAVPHLKELSLRFNHLTLSVDSFHPGALTSITKLESLNLMSNPIGKVPAHYFYPMRNSLRTLVLAGANTDFNVTLEALEGVLYLEVLDLSYNNLETLPESFNGLFTTMQLKQLFLFGNPWRCDCSLKWLREWIDKHNNTQLFVDPKQQLDVNEVILDPLYQMEPVGTTENANFPKCASPSQLAGRPLVNIPGSHTKPVALHDMACSPRPMKDSLTFRGRIGDNVTLKCEFETSIVDEVFWYKNGNPLSPSSRVKVKQLRQGIISVELVFINMQQSDIGTYICLIKNGFGKANTTTILALADSGWLQNVQSDSDWADPFRSNVILKYTGIAAIGIVFILITIGIAVFCLYRRNRKNGIKTVVNACHAKKSPAEIVPLNGMHPMMLDNENNHRYTQPPRYSPSRELPISHNHHQPYVFSFHDNHPLYPMGENELTEVSGNCPVHGIQKSVSSYISSENPYDLRSLAFSTMDRSFTRSRNIVPQMSPVTTMTSLVPSSPARETVNFDSTDYTSCPQHGSALTGQSPTPSDGETPLSPVVRSTRTIKLTPHTKMAPCLTERKPPPKSKHVEFADSLSLSITTASNTPTTMISASPPTTDDPGLITTV